MSPPHAKSGIAERNDVVAAHEGYGSFCFNGLDRSISSIFVSRELSVPDVARALVIVDFKTPGLVGFEAIDLDRERLAVDDDALAPAGTCKAGFIFIHLAELPACRRVSNYDPSLGRINPLGRAAVRFRESSQSIRVCLRQKWGGAGSPPTRSAPNGQPAE